MKYIVQAFIGDFNITPSTPGTEEYEETYLRKEAAIRQAIRLWQLELKMLQ